MKRALILAFVFALLLGYGEASADPLYTYYEVHQDNAYFPTQSAVKDVSATLRRMTEVLEKHGYRGTFLVRPPYAEMCVQYGDTTLRDLEARGHEVGIHTHMYPRETDTVARGYEALRQLGVRSVISANPGFIIKSIMPTDVRERMFEKFKVAAEDMERLGIKIYAGAFGAGEYQPYSPFRPAYEFLYPSGKGPSNNVKSLATGPFVALHGTPSGEYLWQTPQSDKKGRGGRGPGGPGGGARGSRGGEGPYAQRPGGQGPQGRGPAEAGPLTPGTGPALMPATREIQPQELSSAIRPKLQKALLDTEGAYRGSVNFFPLAIHEVEFMGTSTKEGTRVPIYVAENKGFEALDRMLTEVIDPEVRAGRVKFVTMGELYHIYVAHERGAGR